MKIPLPFLQLCILKKATTTIVNHRPQTTYINQPIKATVQVTQQEQIKKDKIDLSLQYKTFHSETPIFINDIITYKNIDFKIYDVADMDDYFGYEANGEQLK